MIVAHRRSDRDVKAADVNKKQMATSKTFGSGMSNNWAERAKTKRQDPPPSWRFHSSTNFHNLFRLTSCWRPRRKWTRDGLWCSAAWSKSVCSMCKDCGSNLDFARLICGSQQGWRWSGSQMKNLFMLPPAPPVFFLPLFESLPFAFKSHQCESCRVSVFCVFFVLRNFVLEFGKTGFCAARWAYGGKKKKK